MWGDQSSVVEVCMGRWNFLIPGQHNTDYGCFVALSSWPWKERTLQPLSRRHGIVVLLLSWGCMMQQHSGGSCVTALAFPFSIFPSRVTWHSDTDQKMERSRGKSADFWPDQGDLWVQLIVWAQGKGMSCLSYWNTFFSSFHFKLKRNSLTATKSETMGRYSVQHDLHLEIASFDQEGQKHWWARVLLEEGLKKGLE